MIVGNCFNCGFGEQIVEELLVYLDANAPETAHVNLIANVPEFYETFGFKACAPELVGMGLRS